MNYMRASALDQVWVDWIHSLSEGELSEDIRVELSLPHPAQRVLGTWKVFSLLYDGSSLISYRIEEFEVIEGVKSEFLYLLATSIVMMSSLLSLLQIQVRRRELEERLREIMERRRELEGLSKEEGGS